MPLSEVLPSPELYDDWKSFARALVSSLDALENQAQSAANVEYVVTTTQFDPDQMPAWPAGYRPVWLNTVDALLYMANAAYDPPTAPDIVYIDTAMIADAAIEANKVANLAIETRAILDNAVSTLKIADDAINAAKVATGAIGSIEIASAAVITDKIANLAITSPLVADAAITTAKIGLLAVTTAVIADAAVATAKIANLAVTSAQIANLTVGSAQIADAAIVSVKIGAAAVLTAAIGDAQVINAKIADATILGAKLVDATIVSAKIANAAIVTALIGDLQVVTAKLGDLAVNEAKVANAAITSAKIANLAVGAAHILTAAIGTAHIADAAITDAKISGTIQSSSWNAATKAGWRIDKAGLIEGQGVAIYDTAGALVFGSGGTLDFSRIIGDSRPDPFSTISDNLWLNAELQVSSVNWSTGATNAYRQAGVVGDPAPYFFRADASVLVAASVANGPVAAVTDVRNQIHVVKAGETLYWSCDVRSTQNIRSVRLLARWYDAAGAFISAPILATITPTAAGAWQAKSGTFVPPANAAKATFYLQFMMNTAVAGDLLDLANVRIARTEKAATVGATIGTNLLGQMTAANISTFIASAAIGTALIANAAINSALIADLAVISAKIADLSVGTTKIADDAITAAKINVAQLDAVSAIVGLLRTASTGARLEIESNQIRVYDASNVLRVRMGVW